MSPNPWDVSSLLGVQGTTEIDCERYLLGDLSSVLSSDVNHELQLVPRKIFAVDHKRMCFSGVAVNLEDYRRVVNGSSIAKVEPAARYEVRF